MKKFLIWILSIVSIVAIADILLGRFAKWYAANNDLGGDYTSFDYIMKNFDDDLLILGNSVSLNSLDAGMMTDSLGVECYNGAINAQTLPFFLTELDVALKSHTPKIIALGLRPHEFDEGGMGERFNFLAPYYGIGYSSIDEDLEKAASSKKFLLKSNLYRFNTIWFRILLYRFITPNEVGDRGFIAKPIPTQFPKLITDNLGDSCVAPERIGQFEEIIRKCKDNNIELIVFFPPEYRRFDGIPPTLSVADSICCRYGVPLINDLSHPRFINDSTLFYDNNHLNADGAKIYTNLFIDYVRKSIK